MSYSNFPGLFPLDVSSTLLPGCNSQKMSADITKCPLKQYPPQQRTTTLTVVFYLVYYSKFLIVPLPHCLFLSILLTDLNLLLIDFLHNALLSFLMVLINSLHICLLYQRLRDGRLKPQHLAQCFAISGILMNAH